MCPLLIRLPFTGCLCDMGLTARKGPPHPSTLAPTRVFPFFMSTSLSKTAARFGSSDSTDQMGGTAG